MGKIEAYEIDDKILKIYSILPYRMECNLEELIVKMAKDRRDETQVDLSKKMAINDFLLTNAILDPNITNNDLNDAEHSLNDKFREIGNYLFEKYVTQYSEKILEKKKLTKSPILAHQAPAKSGLKTTL